MTRGFFDILQKVTRYIRISHPRPILLWVPFQFQNMFVIACLCPVLSLLSNHGRTKTNRFIPSRYPFYLGARKRDTSSRDRSRAIDWPFFRSAASPDSLALSTGENRTDNHHLRRLQHNGLASTRSLSTGVQPDCEALRIGTGLPQEQNEGHIGHGVPKNEGKVCDAVVRVLEKWTGERRADVRHSDKDRVGPRWTCG